MAAKTTKAQRRAAKLNRRSKDYRRQIAAQARKEEQSKKKAKKQTETRAKNPTPKKVYEKSFFNKPAYNPLHHVALALFASTKDGELIGASSYASRDMTPDEMELLIREELPELDAIYVVQMPFGAELIETQEFILEKGQAAIFGALIEGMMELGEYFRWTSLSRFRDNLAASGYCGSVSGWVA